MNAPSLTGFLASAEANFQVFDLGLYLRKLPSSILSNLDNGQPYPTPHLGHAWLALFIWKQDGTEQNSLWFLKLPLDEQGILSTAVHSDLVSRMYRAQKAIDTKERERLLTEHPYQFTPDHEKMAALHAVATDLLALPASEYLENAQNYYLQNDSTTPWQGIGLQGIADLVCRLNAQQVMPLSDALPNLADEPLMALLRQCEHSPLPSSLVKAIANIAANPNQSEDVYIACLRACAQSSSAMLLEASIHNRLASNQFSTEFLLTIITRYTHLLKNDQFAVNVLDKLAKQVDNDGFERVITNLAMQSHMAGIVLKTLASPHLTEALANALSILIKHRRRPPNAHH